MTEGYTLYLLFRIFNFFCVPPLPCIQYIICKMLSKGDSVLNSKVKLSPSALSCNFANAGKQIKEAADAGASYLHLDVMDGLFVPNISFGQPVVKSLRKCTDLVFDVHLMINEPIRYVEDFAKAGSDIITVHAEACSDLSATLEKIKFCGKKCGISIKPKTPVSEIIPYIKMCDLVLIMTVEPGFGGQKFMADMLPKVSEIRKYADENSLQIDIGVDGGINTENASECVKAGANLLIAGSSVFGKENIGDAVRNILRASER